MHFRLNSLGDLGKVEKYVEKEEILDNLHSTILVSEKKIKE